MVVSKLVDFSLRAKNCTIATLKGMLKLFYKFWQVVVDQQRSIDFAMVGWHLDIWSKIKIDCGRAACCSFFFFWKVNKVCLGWTYLIQRIEASISLSDPSRGKYLGNWAQLRTLSPSRSSRCNCRPGKSEPFACDSFANPCLNPVDKPFVCSTK